MTKKLMYDPTVLGGTLGAVNMIGARKYGIAWGDESGWPPVDSAI